MIRNKILLFACSLIIMSNLNAQSLTESLGGTKTNFKICSNTVDLKTVNQIIIQSTEKEYSSDYGYGFGYQSFHLEFVSQNKIAATKAEQLENKELLQLASYNSGNKYLMTFYDSNDQVLLTLTIPLSFVDDFTNASMDNRLYFYSIDLIDVPIIVLDKTTKIDILKIMK